MPSNYVPKRIPLNMTLDEVAAHMGVTRAAVWAGEQRALRKLRAALEADPELGEFLVEHGFALAASAAGD